MNELTDANEILFMQLPDKWKRPPGGHAPPGTKIFPTTCPHLARSCQKPGRQLRTDRSGGCQQSIVPRTYSGACHTGLIWNGIWPVKTCPVYPPKVLFQNKWKKKTEETEEELTNQGSPGKQPVKLSGS